MNDKLAVFLAGALLVLLALAVSYLIFVGLAAIIIWAFSLAWNPWTAGLGIWAVVIIGRWIFK